MPITGAEKARKIVSRLAETTRFAGSIDETDARQYCRSQLEEQGFFVEEQPFEFSKTPAMWGPSLTSALAATTVWLGAHLAIAHHSPVQGLLTELGGLSAIAIVAMLGARFGVPGLPLQRSKSVNLVAVRHEATSRPTTWLCAHIDSKSQTIPMLARVTSTIFFAVLSGAAAASLLVLAFLPGVVPELGTLTTILSWLAVAAALPIILCFVSNDSKGALDNATGVASILLAAEQIGSKRNVGVVITSAEEFGLAGARYFAATESAGEIAINCDTIDDNGFFYCMASGARIRRVDAAIDRAASRLGIRTGGIPGRPSRGSLRLRRMIPGILADNVAFTAGGWESFTLSRGNIGTLAYVHTSRDMSDRLSGTGIAQASSLIAAIVEELA